jgi:hypothetical protein
MSHGAMFSLDMYQPSEEHGGFVFVVEEVSISSTLKMEALCFLETVVPP